MAAEAEGGAAVTQTRITQLEETLEAMAETLRYGIVILEDYKMENQEGLWSKINQITTQLGAASQAKQSVDDIEVPVELLAYVDAGKNPDVYTKEVLEACRSRNEQSFGKITAFECLKSALEKEVAQVWPDETAKMQKFQAASQTWSE